VRDLDIVKLKESADLNQLSEYNFRKGCYLDLKIVRGEHYTVQFRGIDFQYRTGVSAGKFHLGGIARFIVASYKRDVSDAARPSLPSVPSVSPYVLFFPSLSPSYTFYLSLFLSLSLSLSHIPRASIYH